MPHPVQHHLELCSLALSNQGIDFHGFVIFLDGSFAIGPHLGNSVLGITLCDGPDVAEIDLPGIDGRGECSLNDGGGIPELEAG